MTGSTGVYNLSGADSVLNTGGAAIVGDSADGGEVVGDGGGTGTFNQFSGTNIATDGGLAVGSDVYGSGVGGLGVFNLEGGSLVASGLPQAVGGEVIGTCRGIGTFNQSGGTNTVLAGLFVGSNINYSLSPSPIVPVGGTGTYNLSGGALTAQGGSAVYYGPTVFVPGESIGEGGGTGTFNQTGGTNTVTDGLCVGTDLFRSNEGPGTGAYNLSGGALNAVGNGTIGSADFMPGETIGDGRGTGTFTQTGGTNTVAGGLYVGSEILASGAGGSGAYNLYGGVLQADYEYVGGAGTFTQTGGTNTVTGAGVQYGIEMNGGVYHLNGGTLTANSIDGNLDNQGGTFVPSNAGALLTGDYTQGKNGVLLIAIDSANNYSSLNMGGTGAAIFNGGSIQPVLQGGFVPTPGETFDVITNAQNITGAPAIENFTATLLAVEGNTADPGMTITAVRDYANSGLTLSQNQKQVGNMLNKVSGVTTGDLGTVLHAIDSIPASSANLVGNVYQQISPDVAASLANLGFAASAFFQKDLSERITNLRYAGLEGQMPGGFGASGPALAMNPAGASTLAGAEPSGALQANGWNFYADPQVSWGSQSSTAQETGYSFSIGGLTAGADYHVRDDLLAGLATGYGHTDAGFYDNPGNVQNDTVPINLYAAYFPGSFYAYGSAGYAANLFSTTRQIVFDSIDRKASGSTTGNMFNGYAEAGYDLKAWGAVLTPMASLAYSSLWIDGFGETGADSLDLNVQSQHADSFQLGPGVRLATVLKYGGAVLAPQFYASYKHEFSNGSRGIDASLANVGVPFSFESQRLGADFGVIGGSLTLFSGKNFSVRLDSNAEVGRANYNAYTVDAGLSFRF